jgi:hypothetical protein
VLYVPRMSTNATATTATTASAVSAALRRAGFLPVPRTREGLHVTGKLPVAVFADYDSRSTSRAMIAEARDVLVGLGYVVRDSGDPDVHGLFVDGRAAAPAEPEQPAEDVLECGCPDPLTHGVTRAYCDCGAVEVAAIVAVTEAPAQALYVWGDRQLDVPARYECPAAAEDAGAALLRLAEPAPPIVRTAVARAIRGTVVGGHGRRARLADLADRVERGDVYGA